MYIGSDLDPGAWGESIVRSMNFEHVLSTGETIAAVAPWICTVAADTTDQDATPAARVAGAPFIDGTRSRQRLTFPDGPATRVKYVLEAEVTTSLGNVIKRWTHLWVRRLKLCPDLGDGQPGEDINHTMQFARDLSAGEQIVSSVWSIEVAADSANPDAGVASRLVGISTHSLTDSYQEIVLPADLVGPVRYLLGATVVTTLGNTIKLHAYKNVRAAS